MLKRNSTIGLNTTMGVGGALVGYDIVATDGSIAKSVTYDKPIRNMITDAGLDFMCGVVWHNGGPLAAATTDSDSFSPVNNREGVLRECGIGENGNPTTSDMVTLQDINAVWSADPTLATGTPTTGRIGTWCDFDASGDTPTRLKMRVSHKFTVAQSEGKTVREIGWRRPSIPNPIFSRIALPAGQEIEVPVNHFLQVTYEITINIPYVTPVIVPDFGFTGFEDHPVVRGEQRLDCLLPPQSIAWGTCSNQFFPTVATNNGLGVGQVGLSTVSSNISYATLAQNNTPSMSIHKGLGTSFDSFDIAQNLHNTNIWWRANGAMASAANYVKDSHTRKVTFTWNVNSPDTTNSITFDRVNMAGMGFRFGYYNGDGVWVSEPLTKHGAQVLTFEYSVKWNRA